MHFIIFLFIIELFFGFNGKWLVLGGVSARHWLFAIMLFMVYGKAVYYFWKNWKFEKELSFLGFLCKELRTFKFFDRFLAVFVASHIIWIVVIPYMQQKTNPGGLGLGILSFTLLVDSVVFRGMNITRMLATFEVSQDTLEKGEAQS